MIYIYITIYINIQYPQYLQSPYSQPTVTLQSTYSQSTVNLQSIYSQPTVNLQSIYSIYIHVHYYCLYIIIDFVIIIIVIIWLIYYDIVIYILYIYILLLFTIVIYFYYIYIWLSVYKLKFHSSTTHSLGSEESEPPAKTLRPGAGGKHLAGAAGRNGLPLRQRRVGTSNSYPLVICYIAITHCHFVRRFTS